MRTIAFCLLCAVIAVPVLGQVPQTITDTELTRYLDRASKALIKASKDAEKGQAVALRESLKRANEAWMDCYGRYRQWVSADTGWQKDFDAITASLTSAVNALTPGNSVPNAKVQIDAALATLTALRDRNGVPDLEATMDEVSKSLKSMQATMSALGGKRLTSGDIKSLQVSYTDAAESWQRFTKAAVDLNVLGLSSGELDKLRKMVALQNVSLDTISNVLKNPETARLVAELQSAQDQLAELVQQLNPNLTDSDSDEPAAGDSEDTAADDSDDSTKDGRGRPRLLPDRPRLLPRR
ncbi:MAG: hypothetical protein IT365_19045 [Candidatus Hydrogenedentes bacterium]|nr:hypothetical protein [Candidatus Hydrogenedentota bacterium]